MSIFRKKEITVPVNDSGGMKKNLKTMDLIFLGIGAVVGTGIFVVTGVAAERYAGPGLVLSFLVAAARLFYLVYAMQNLHHVFRSLVGRMPTCMWSLEKLWLG